MARISSESPLHIVVLADTSASMGVGDSPRPVDTLTEAIKEWIVVLQAESRGNKPYFFFSLVSFNDEAETLWERVNVNRIDEEHLTLQATGLTDMALAIDAATQILAADGAQRDVPLGDHVPLVFLLTDGHPNDAEATLSARDRLVGLNYGQGLRPKLVCIGFGEAHESYLEQLAGSRDRALMVNSVYQLVALLPDIGTPKTNRVVAVEDKIREARRKPKVI